MHGDGINGARDQHGDGIKGACAVTAKLARFRWMANGPKNFKQVSEAREINTKQARLFLFGLRRCTHPNSK
jgi:hypothetical protein